MDQEAKRLASVGNGHEQVARLLGDPAAVRVCGTSDELDPPPLERDEEENVDPSQPNGLDGKKVTSEHGRRLLTQELPPT
jgi:hypothetical protein